MASLKFDESLVKIFEQPPNREKVERDLAAKLVEQGYAKLSFTEAILQRELTYPTGLEFGSFAAAIPHCAPENVNTPALCVGVLKSPITWGRMDDKNQTCQVSFVTMLAIIDPKDHLFMLQKVVGLIRDADLAQRILYAGDPAEVYGLVHDKLA